MEKKTKKILPTDFNGWETGKILGRGGNGKVFEVEKNGKQGALKLLHQNPNRLRLTRFKDEVQAMRKCSDIPGVLPVYDECLDSSEPWFVMARATPIRDSLKDNVRLHNIVTAIHGIAKVLGAMHAKGITHRDIKPENLFIYNNIWSVGDFGLATFEGKESETATGEKIGPIHYIAPEMLNDAGTSKGEPADVFSLAKTLWVLATGQNFALPGSYDPMYDAFRIGKYVKEERTGQLDKLIEACTMILPEMRPSMQTVEDELNSWLNPIDVNKKIALKIDIGRYAAILDNAENELQAKRARERKQFIIENQVATRISSSFRPFMEEFELLLKTLKFKDVEYSDDHGGKLVAYIATTDHSSPHFSFLFNTKVTGVNVCVDVVATFKRGRGAFFSRLVLWKKKVEFIEGSSAELTQINLLLGSISDQISTLVTMALEIAFGPSEDLINISSLLNYDIKVHAENKEPILGATVVMIRKDGLHDVFQTDNTGSMYHSNGPKDPFIIFVAHDEFKGRAFLASGKSERITLEREVGSGSLFATTGWIKIPHVGFGIDFKVDGSERMYFYSSDGIVINDGVQQPFSIEVGGSAYLKNNIGSEVEITLSAVHGRCLLLDFRIIK